MENIDNELFKKDTYIFFEFFAYFAIFIILFAFMYELNAVNLIFGLITIMHIIYNLKLFNVTKDIFAVPTNGILSGFISFTLFSTILIRTLALFLYYYTSAKISFIAKKNDEKLIIPIKFKKNDIHYKFSFIASTIASFIVLLLVKFFSGSVLETSMNTENGLIKALIVALLGAVSYGFSTLIPEIYAFQTYVYTSSFFVVLLTILKFLMSYIKDANPIGNLYYQLIAIVATLSLAVTSAFEFKNSFEYKDLHEKYKVINNTPPVKTEDDKKMHYYKEMIINFFLFMFTFIMFFIIGTYALGTGGENYLYLFIVGLLLTLYMLKDVLGDFDKYLYNAFILVFNALSYITNAFLHGSIFISKMVYKLVLSPIYYILKNIIILFQRIIQDLTRSSKQN